MKLTKSKLKQLIKEEMQSLQEAWPSSKTKPKLDRYVGYPTSAQFNEEDFLALLGPLEQQLANMLGRAETKNMTMLPDQVEEAYKEFRDKADKLLKAMRGIDASADPEKYSRTGPYARKEPKMGIYENETN